MLPGEESCDAAHRRIPLAEHTALRLECALISNDRATRQRELANAFAGDAAIAGWALRLAEHHLRRPINRVDEAADWLSGCLEQQLATSLKAEPGGSQPIDFESRFSALVAKLDAYERQLDAFQHRLEREKLDSLKELAYGAGHEINNPLANIAARAQMLLADEPEPERRRKLAAIHRQAMRAHEMIADLMLFARPPKLLPAPCDLAEMLRPLVEQLRDLATEYHVELDWEAEPESIQLEADATQLAVAVRAVIVNALEATGDGGHVRVALRRRAFRGRQYAEFAVCDDGPGIADDVRRHMFDPFYSGREAGRGLGFGLSKCWRIVNDHRGQVVVQRRIAGGAQIAILLPLEKRDLAVAELPNERL
jgi:signal transduction histidine kinase